MRKAIPGITLLAAVLMAAAPAPKPVITISGVTAAVGLDASVRATIAKNVAGLNAGLETIVALHRSYSTASPAERERIVRDMTDIHAKCKAMHDAIVAVLDPTQQKAYFAYLHAQLKAAGIDMTQMQHDGTMPDGMHDHDSLPGAMAGAGHSG